MLLLLLLFCRNPYCLHFYGSSKINLFNNIFSSQFLFLWAVCEETHSPKSYRYHPGLWSGKKWSCCKTINRTAFGCQAATHWTETNNNPTPSKLYYLSFSRVFFVVSIDCFVRFPFYRYAYRLFLIFFYWKTCILCCLFVQTKVNSMT